MRFALILICGLLVAVPAYGEIAVGIQRSTHTHFFNEATVVDGIAGIGDFRGGHETWTIPGLKPTDVGRIFMLTEENAADYGFDFGAARSYWSDFEQYLAAGTVIDTDVHIEDTANQVHRIKGPLQNIQFRVLSWTDTPNPPAPGYKTLVVETRVHYLVPELASLCLAVFGLLASTCLRWRWQRST